MPGAEGSPHDLLSLAREPLAGRLVALESVWGAPAGDGPLPSEAVQVSGLVVAEAIRLIRLGSTVELASSSLELARLLNRREARALPERHPEAHRLLSGAAVALAAAAAPQSPGGEEAVRRSWNGRAEEAVRILMESQGRSMARSELRARLGEPAESHLSHMLSDLEAAGLVVRIRDGRTVTVHLGPAAREGALVERIAGRPKVTTWPTASAEREVHHTRIAALHHTTLAAYDVYIERAVREIVAPVEEEPGTGAGAKIPVSMWVPRIPPGPEPAPGRIVDYREIRPAVLEAHGFNLLGYRAEGLPEAEPDT